MSGLQKILKFDFIMNSIDSKEYIGLAAAFLTTVAFVPQIIKIYRSKEAKDVSFITFTMFGLGVLLWDVYGWSIHSMSVVIANTITFILSIVIVIMKIIFSSK